MFYIVRSDKSYRMSPTAEGAIVVADEMMDGDCEHVGIFGEGRPAQFLASYHSGGTLIADAEEWKQYEHPLAITKVIQQSIID